MTDQINPSCEGCFEAKNRQTRLDITQVIANSETLQFEALKEKIGECGLRQMINGERLKLETDYTTATRTRIIANKCTNIAQEQVVEITTCQGPTKYEESTEAGTWLMETCGLRPGDANGIFIKNSVDAQG